MTTMMPTLDDEAPIAAAAAGYQRPTLRPIPNIPRNMHPVRLLDQLAFCAKDSRDVMTRLVSDDQIDLAALRAEMALLARSILVACQSAAALANSVAQASRQESGGISHGRLVGH